jgi:1-acyl-sn-glycerol-3-phosphate acyltransferase
MDNTLASPGRALVRLLGYAGLTAPCLLVQAVALVLRLPLRSSLPVWYHRQSARLLGIRVQRRGRPCRKHPTLFIANHVSYFDIMVMGSLVKASFVAKSEIADWPFFGLLAKLQRSVFVDRRPSGARTHRDEMMARLEAGDDLILFPEGTSGPGNGVLPFKSALFAVAEPRPHGEPITVQPVSITYTLLDGMPMGRAFRPFFAWYGDMDLPPHLWHALGLGRLTVQVQFHRSVTIDDFPSRKALSNHCHRVIGEGVASALAGRPQHYPESGAAAVAGAEPVNP